MKRLASQQRHNNMYKKHHTAASYLTLFVNCTPVLITRGLSGCMGIHGCLSTTKALRRRRESLILEKTSS